MLTKDEVNFFKNQGLSPDDVYDGRSESSAAWKAGVRSAGKTVVLGTPCSSKNHRLRTRSGHCAQCDTAKLSYQKRHNTEGYVYIAGSKSAKLLKVGTCVDVDRRRKNLRHQGYVNNEKDGKKQEVAEMLKTSFSVALSVFQQSLKTTKATEIRKALRTSDYEFK